MINPPPKRRRPVHERLGVATRWNAPAQGTVAFAATGPTRAERYVVALEVGCPRCAARAGEPCARSYSSGSTIEVEDMGKRVHRERFELASGEP